MDRIGTLAAVLSGIFTVVFVTTFVWGVGKRILRWALIAAVAYAAVVMAVRIAHLGVDGAAITMTDLLAATLGPHCSAGEPATSRSSACTSPVR